MYITVSGSRSVELDIFRDIVSLLTWSQEER
jgi:hypothetical protein